MEPLVERMDNGTLVWTAYAMSIEGRSPAELMRLVMERLWDEQERYRCFRAMCDGWYEAHNRSYMPD